MDKLDKITTVAGAVIFGVLGLGALIGAAFFGATHQLAIAAISLMVAAVLLKEAMGDKKRKTNKS